MFVFASCVLSIPRPRLSVQFIFPDRNSPNQALDNFTGGAADSRGKLEVFTPPERSVVAEMGPRGGAGPVPPVDGDSVDFVLTLGGDGLLMYSNTLFRVSWWMP